MSTQRVFISYSFADADLVWIRAFAESLRQRGIQVWLDESEVRPGDSVLKQTEDGLRHSDIIVSVISADSLKKPNLYFEIGAAVGMGKRVVAILPKTLDPALLPLPLRTRKFLLQESPEETANKLLVEVNGKQRVK